MMRCKNDLECVVRVRKCSSRSCDSVPDRMFWNHLVNSISTNLINISQFMVHKSFIMLQNFALIDRYNIVKEKREISLTMITLVLLFLT